jgi:hypothetical protein
VISDEVGWLRTVYKSKYHEECDRKEGYKGHASEEKYGIQCCKHKLREKYHNEERHRKQYKED